MSLNSTLLSALGSILPTYPDYYDGTNQEYLVFSYSRRPSFSADDVPYQLIAEVTVDYVAPPKKNVLSTRDSIIAAIWGLSGTYPDETNASTDDYQHYVYEFEIEQDVVT